MSDTTIDLPPTLRRDRARSALAAWLRDAGIESADLDARLLVCAACGIDHAALIRDPDTPLGAAAPTLVIWAARRIAREPVSRILGRREFWGLPFAVTPAVLDPRPDTEGLIGAAIDAIGGRARGPLRILDLGTGSGAILCALLHELPLATGVGIDRSLAACRVARGNLAVLGLAARADVVCADWADPLAGRFDLVVSNPPYIPRGDLAGLDADVRDYDPPPALDGGDDGLDAYRRVIPQLADLLGPKGVAAFECGWDQGASVAQSMRDAGLRGVTTCRDLAGHGRVVLGVER